MPPPDPGPMPGPSPSPSPVPLPVPAPPPLPGPRLSVCAAASATTPMRDRGSAGAATIGATTAGRTSAGSATAFGAGRCGGGIFMATIRGGGRRTGTGLDSFSRPSLITFGGGAGSWSRLASAATGPGVTRNTSRIGSG